MADNYLHSALRGEQLHESRIKVLPAGTPIPVPEWEGQFLAVGKNLYYAVKQSGTLTWIQPTATNAPVLPSNVVTFESGDANPPVARSGSGKIYTNSSTKDSWYLSGGQWVKLGTGSNRSFDIISGRAAENWMGNYFGLLNPDDPAQDNCLVITKYVENVKYYLAVKIPTMSSLGGSDDNKFYLELWRENGVKTVISTCDESKENLAVLNTLGFTTSSIYRLGLHIKRNSTKLYLNFVFNIDTRLLEVKQFANVSYGY
jgi:hypothetical protein